LSVLSEVDLLRGLIETHDGLALHLLQAAGVDLAELRTELISPSGPDAQQRIEQAEAESRQRGDSWIGTEHLLLAVARRPGSRAGEMLVARGASAQRLEQLLAQATGEWQRTHPPLLRRLGGGCRAVLNWLRKRA
jgi:ATP-dependent Clp protease ATP-binding subunit ClpA